MLGLQPRVINRGFLFDDDYAGAAITYKGEGFSVPFIWLKAYEGGMGNDKNDNDVDYYVLNPTFAIGKSALKPTLAYIYSKDASNWPSTTGNKELKVYFVGLDADVNFDMGSAWFTGIYEGGDADLLDGTSVDVKAYLLALGGTVNMGAFDIHGRAFYATGDDTTDKDAEAFFVPRGQSYYWSEIMGLGIFDNQASAEFLRGQDQQHHGGQHRRRLQGDGQAEVHSRPVACQAGRRRCRRATTTLGTEIDFRMTYALMKNLNLDMVAAYLFAGRCHLHGEPTTRMPTKSAP